MDAYEIAKKHGFEYAQNTEIFREAPLSGEFAGDIVVPEVYARIEEELGREMTSDEYEWTLDEWEAGYFEFWK